MQAQLLTDAAVAQNDHTMLPGVTQKPILAAGFAGLPEYPILARLSNHVHWKMRLLLFDSRLELIQFVGTVRPQGVLLSVHDLNGYDNTPLIARLKHTYPGVARALLIRSGAATKGLAEALRVGAHLFQWTTSDDIEQIVEELCGARASIMSAPDDLAALLHGMYPDWCVRVLLHCINAAPEALRVSDVANALHISSRSLGRRLSQAAWPTPYELIEWGRLLHFSLAHRGKA